MSLLIPLAALSLLNWHLWHTEIDTRPLRLEGNGAARDQGEHPTVDRIKLQPLRAFDQISNRPIFNATRRPAKERPPKPRKKIQAAKSNRTPWQQIRLMGVVMDAEIRQILLQTPKKKNGIWLSENTQIEGWTIVQIEESQVTIRSAADKQVLKLYETRGISSGR